MDYDTAAPLIMSTLFAIVLIATMSSLVWAAVQDGRDQARALVSRER